MLCRRAASCRQVIVVGRDLLNASRHVRHYYIRSEVFEENHRAQNSCGMLEALWNDPWKWMCGTDMRQATTTNEVRNELRRQRDYLAGKREK